MGRDGGTTASGAHRSLFGSGLARKHVHGNPGAHAVPAAQEARVRDRQPITPSTSPASSRASAASAASSAAEPQARVNA
jgi:hypothetical protein